MTLLARALSSGDLVADTNAKVSASEARALVACGLKAIGRYVFFGSPRPGDIDEGELQLLTAAGLCVYLIQHVRNPSWHASEQSGTADAQAAISNAIRAGYDLPHGSDAPPLALVLDMEGLGNPGPGAFAHASAWCEAVVLAGYQPAVYVGYDSGLSSPALDSLPGLPVFWVDFGDPHQRPTPKRGYALRQHAQSTLAGIGVDIDTVLQDGALYGLADGDVNVETPDMRETPTLPELPGAA